MTHLAFEMNRLQARVVSSSFLSRSSSSLRWSGNVPSMILGMPASRPKNHQPGISSRALSAQVVLTVITLSATTGHDEHVSTSEHDRDRGSLTGRSTQQEHACMSEPIRKFNVIVSLAFAVV